MLSKQVADRESSSRTVQAAFQTHAGPASQAVSARFAPVLGDGSSPVDVAGMVHAAGRLLALRTDDMVRTDIAHTRELGDDAPKRAARDAAQGAVVGLVTSIRIALTGRFGEDFGGRLGLVGKAPDTPSDVLSWARQVKAALAETELPTIDTSADDNDEVAVFSKEDALNKLTRRIATLEEALAATAVEAREAEVTQYAKDQAIAAYDETFRFAAGLLELVLRAGGFPDYAERVRPSVRRPGQTVDAAEGRQPGTPSPRPTEPDAGA